MTLDKNMLYKKLWWSMRSANFVADDIFIWSYEACILCLSKFPIYPWKLIQSFSYPWNLSDPFYTLEILTWSIPFPYRYIFLYSTIKFGCKQGRT